ncbi:phosphate ABC transporter substrate-binding protein PstS [Streptomyces sp. NPDC047043]|uniref:phosphate ABC transporter substrate-binding protein PstS n=1 Tax=Streptomyces sp. NPDC047043 TaxID=3154497 RepID=UPI0033FC86DE
MTSPPKSGPYPLTVGAAVVCGALVLSGCGAEHNSSTPSSRAPATPLASTTVAAGGITCGKAAGLLASGSSAQQYAMQYWIKNFTRACPGTRITYNGTGSGAGQTDFLHGRTAFAGSDSALSPDQITQSKSVCTDGGRAVDLPMLGGPIAVGFNVRGVGKLVLDAPTLAKIFDSQITAWNDPAIAKLNPGTTLPKTPIRPLHRADASGTTDNFTSYLGATASSTWPYKHGKQWVAKGGQSAKGSSGLATKVKQTAGAIGYFELPYAIDNAIPTTSIATGAASPVDPNIITASKAIAGAKISGTAGDITLALDYSTKAANAYPIDMVTYEVVCNKGNKPATWPATKAFLTYIAGRKGQQDLSFQGYATLPADVIAKVRASINNMP